MTRGLLEAPSREPIVNGPSHRPVTAPRCNGFPHLRHLRESHSIVMHPVNVVDSIEALFDRHGGTCCDGLHARPLTLLAHALQCAQCAEAARSGPELTAAALLHDIGHFIGADAADSEDGEHEVRAAVFLAGSFGKAVTEPIRLHVQAKRYLVGNDERYLAALTPASRRSLAMQGGPMTEAELRAFDALPFARDALRLRCWDDLAKVHGRRVPPLSYYLDLLRELAAA